MTTKNKEQKKKQVDNEKNDSKAAFKNTKTGIMYSKNMKKAST